MQRTRNKTEDILAETTISNRTQVEEPEWVVWLTVMIALLIGFVLQYTVTNRMRAMTIGDSTISYPASWSLISRDKSGFTAADVTTGGPFAPRISFHQLDQRVLLPGGGMLYNAGVNWSVKKREEHDGYRLLEIKNVKVQGRDALQLESAFLMDVGTNRMPGLMRSVDTLVLDGKTFRILSFSAEQNQFDQLEPLRKQMMASWTFAQSQ